MTARPPAARAVHRPAVVETTLQGHYAGAVSRLVAYVVDLGVISGVFTVTLAAVSFVAGVVTGHQPDWNRQNGVVAICYLAWGFVYYAYSWSAAGRTLGMSLLGVRVVRRDGADVSGGRAVARTLALPLSFLFFGLGFAGILLGRERRALHDVIAGTAVVYSWDARAARLRFLARESGGTRPGPRES